MKRRELLKALVVAPLAGLLPKKKSPVGDVHDWAFSGPRTAMGAEVLSRENMELYLNRIYEDVVNLKNTDHATVYISQQLNDYMIEYSWPHRKLDNKNPRLTYFRDIPKLEYYK